MIRRIANLLIMSMVILFMTACSANDAVNISTEGSSDESWKLNTGNIELDTMSVSGSGVSVENNVIKITEGGDFTLTGTLADGMIYVNSEDKVKLRLSGVNITNTTGSAIFFENAEKAFITISTGTENVITDGSEYSVDAKAAIFSNDDIEIKGEGTLTVNGNYNHCIASDDKISVEEGIFILNASVGDGIHANDGIDISGGDITITALGDGIQSEGYINISDGNVNITTNGEVESSKTMGDMPRGGGNHNMNGGEAPEMPEGGFNNNGEAPEMLEGGFNNNGEAPEMPEGGFNNNGEAPEMPEGGFNNNGGAPKMPEGGFNNSEVPQLPEGTEDNGYLSQDRQGRMQNQESATEVTSFDSAANTETTAETEETAKSTKGIKSGAEMIISGGTLTINSADHGIYSQDTLTIDGGTITISSQQGKGIKSLGEMNINNGVVDIQKSTEGIESTARLNINGGDIRISASDDGINTGGGNDNMMMGNRGSSENPEAAEHQITINGGTIYVDASGDGIDSNGNLVFNGGSIIVDGPVNSGNGALDTNGSNTINGGTLIACSSAGMAEYPTSDSQNILNISFDSSQTAGSTVTIEDSTGNVILSYVPSKAYQVVIFSSEDIKTGETYTVKVDGTEMLSGTVEGNVTSIGNANFRFGSGQRNGGMKGQGQRTADAAN